MTNQSDDVVTVSVNFALPTNDGGPAYRYASRVNLPEGKPEINFSLGPQTVQITNLRKTLTENPESMPTVNTHGFQFCSGYPSSHKKFEDDEEIEKEYYPESEALMKKFLGCSRVFIFDHTIRRRRPGVKDAPGQRQPATGTHVDQTPAAAVARVRKHLPAEADELLKKRFQIINVWRPINHEAYDWPLALCDFRSVEREKDIMPVTLYYPDMMGETFAVKYNPNYKWSYLKGMRPDEFILFKCYDSIQDGSVSAFAPHTAFEDPTTPEGTPLRESVELRALVFYD